MKAAPAPRFARAVCCSKALQPRFLNQGCRAMVGLWALLLGSIEYYCCIRVSLGIPQALRLKASGPALLSIGFRV